ncbi:MAG: hypothetical protein KJ598_04235, partial [Nanoarchaeota archaeon]|nr:hypothetical protein [Nanoarchaeota archaeon]MBU1644339.1 hypothetical protein [Nanoarchaeota archaeon]
MVEDITTLNQRRKELEARINKLELQRDKTAFLLQQLELKGKKKGSSLMINRDRNQLVSLEQFETEEISKAKRELDQLNQINQAHNQEEKNHQKIKVTIVFCLLLMTLSLFTLITIQLDHNFGVISGAPTLSGIGQNKTVQDQTGNNSPISRMLDKLSEKISLSITGAAITVNTLSESTGSEIQSSGSIQSSGLISISATPTHSTPILNSTNPATNDTNQNLTAYNQSTADGDGDPVKNIYNWKVDGISFASINLPFEGGSTDIFTREYANGNDPVVTDALWNSTGGYDGKGAYQFDGAGDIITIPSVYLNGSQNFSVFTWATTNKFDQYRTLFIKPGSLHILFANIAGGGISCRVTNTTGTINVVTTNTGVWTDSNWHFIGCQVYSNQSIEISVDGIVVRTGTYAGPHNVTTSDIIISQTGGVDWNGTVDEVMFFNHSLSPQQVLALYHNRTDLIVSQETSRGDNWSVEITPNDGSNDGTTLSSNGVTILNAKPTHLTPILNSTDPTTNNTYQNLTAYNQSTNDLDGDSVKNIYNWLKDGSSIAVLNIPFEASANLFNATDYADFDNNATSLYGSPVYNQTSGYDGKGAYEFSTADEAVILATTNFPTIGEGNYTVMAWVKTKGTPTHNYQTIFSINNYDPGFYIGGGTSLLVYDSGGLYSNAGLSLNDNLWHHVAFVRAGVVGGGNQLKFYMDGESVGSNNHVASISPATNLRIGYDGASTEDFEGTIDEFMFLNISLSPEQIKLIYQNQSNILVSNQNNVGDSWSVQITPNDGIEEGITLTSNSLVVQEYVDITNPSITIQSPLNNSRYSSNVSLTFTVSDNVAVDSCWYYLDGGANTALTGCANTSVSLTRGPHNITFYVNDTSNNLNSSGLINFSVNYLPTVDSLILNTTNPATNNTNQNLTVYNTTSDADGDSVKVIYNWLVNGTSLTLLNLPFEADDNTNTADYSGYGKNGTVVGTLTWNGNSGYDGKGAYYFDGISGNPKYVQIDDASLFDVKNFTYS